MSSIQFKGESNLSEVRDFLNRNTVSYSVRTREAFVEDGRSYPSVILVEYTDETGVRRVLTPGRSIRIENGVITQAPSQK